MIRTLLLCTLFSGCLSLFGQETHRGFTVGVQHAFSLQETFAGELYRDSELFNL